MDLIFNRKYFDNKLNKFDSKSRLSLKSDSFVSSAIILLIIPHENKSYDLILIRRTYRENDKHSGEISFAGGKFDVALDKSLKDTALREIEEELGIPRNRTIILGCLDDHITPKRFIITPFVGYIDENQLLTKQDDEVQEIIKIPISFFINKENYREQCYKLRDELIAVGKYVYRAPNNKKYVIFGATCHIIVSFIESLYDITLKHPQARRLNPSDFK